MKKWGLSIFGLLVLLLLLAACGKPDTKKAELVLITNGSDISSGDRNRLTWEALQQFAEEQGKTCTYLVPKTQTAEGYSAMISQAAGEGAEVIICAGKEFESAVYSAQRDYRNVRFLLLDGVPINGKNKERLRGNTRSIEPDSREAGYLAGYAAVTSGYRSLGYLGGRDEYGGQLYGDGFVLGAEAAAVALGLQDGSVTLQYDERGTDAVSPDFLKEMKDWYQSGCQVIFTGDSTCENVVRQAAKETGGAVIRAGGDSLPDAVVMAVRLEYGDVVYKVLQTIAEDQYEGGEKMTAGIANGGISLLWNRDLLTSFTDSQYRDVCQKMEEEEFSLTEKDVLTDPEAGGITKVQVLPLKGEEDAGSE